MLQALATLVAALGVGLALVAFLMDGTGVNGTSGAFLAVIGSVAALLGLALMVGVRLSLWQRRLVAGLAVLAAALTALAAWFLMQDLLTAVMALVCIGILGVAAMTRPTLRSTTQ